MSQTRDFAIPRNCKIEEVAPPRTTVVTKTTMRVAHTIFSLSRLVFSGTINESATQSLHFQGENCGYMQQGHEVQQTTSQPNFNHGNDTSYPETPTWLT